MLLSCRYSAYLEAVKIRVTLAYNNSFQSKPLKPKMLAMKLNYENVPTTCLRNQTDRNISSGPSFVGYNAHQVNAARVALPNQTSDVINAVMDDQKADHTDSDSFRAEYRYQRGYTKPLERLKSRVWVHLALFSMTVGIIVVTTALCFLNFGNPEFSEVEMIPTSNIQIANFMPTPAVSSTERTKTELKIKSSQDFKLLAPFHSSVDISNLNEKYDDGFSYLQRSDNNVLQITVSGYISPEWFYFIMREFSATRSLTIDMKTFCSQIVSIENFKQNVITFKGIENYSIKNFNQCNSPLSKFFLSLGLPSIKYFLIEDSSLNFERYKVLEQFLKNHTVLFHVVTFQRCFICKQCKVLDVAFPNSEVEIFNRKKDPFE